MSDLPKTLKYESFFHCIVTNNGWKVNSVVFVPSHVAEGFLLKTFLGTDVSVERQVSSLKFNINFLEGGSPGDVGNTLREEAWNPDLLISYA